MFLNATDVQPNHLVAQLGEKYKGIPPEVLRDQPEFFNDLLRYCCQLLELSHVFTISMVGKIDDCGFLMSAFSCH
jgi:hypothetical protein